MNLRPLLCLLLLMAFSAARAAEEPGQPISVESLDEKGGGEFDLRTGTAIYTNGVIARYGDTVLTADKLQINQATGEAFAEGDVVILNHAMQVWRGERVNYNFKTRVMTTDAFRSGQPPFFIHATNLVNMPASNAYIATNATLTTDDSPQPNYRIRARKIVIVPGKSIEARHATLFLGDVPVFYFPYFHRRQDRHPNNYDFVAGYRSSWGAFLLNTYNWYWDEQLYGALHFDLRSKRGLAGGADFKWFDRTFGEGLLRYYYAQDTDPREVIGFETSENNRHRLLFQDRIQVDPSFALRSQVSYETDPFVRRDFFESEFEDDVQPKSFVEADKDWQNWSLNGLAQFRVNDFYETIERLPDVKLTGMRQQLGPTPLFYESESSVGYFRHLFPEETNIFYPANVPGRFSATRADTFHQVLLPWTFFGWLNVIPRVGQRLTYSSEANERGATTDEELRSVFNTGAEVTWKASRVYRNVESDLLDLDGLRHIIEPSVNYVFVPDPDERPWEVPQFDRTLPTSRLLPIDFPDFNAIDSIDSRNVVRFGVRNRIETKREEGVDYLLNWALFADWRLDPDHERGRGPAGPIIRKQDTFSDLYSDIEFRPRSWLALNSQTRYDLGHAEFQEVNHTLTVQPSTVWSFSIGHRYRKEDIELFGFGVPAFTTGQDVLFTQFFYRLNENWGFRVQHHFDLENGFIQRQHYSVYRDFRSFTGALTFRIHDALGEEADWTIAFTISLKAMPRFGVGDDAVRPARLIGG